MPCGCPHPNRRVVRRMASVTAAAGDFSRGYRVSFEFVLWGNARHPGPTALNRPELLHRRHVRDELVEGDLGALQPAGCLVRLNVGFIAMQRREDVASAGSDTF